MIVQGTHVWDTADAELMIINGAFGARDRAQGEAAKNDIRTSGDGPAPSPTGKSVVQCYFTFVSLPSMTAVQLLPSGDVSNL
jgi:hypothetical protein